MKNTLLLRKVFLFWVFSLSLLLTPSLVVGQVNYVTWNFSTSISGANYASSTTNQNAVRTSALTNPTLSAISTTGATTVGANTNHRTTSWSVALDTAKYLEFSVTLGSGQTFSNASLNLLVSALVSSTGTAARNYQVQYLWGTSTFAPVSGTNAANATATNGGTITSLLITATSNTAIIPAPGNITTTTLKIRIYAYGSSGAGNIQFASIALTGPAPLTPATAPSVTTIAVSNITNNTATLGGNVTATGGSNITANGSVYAQTNINAAPVLGGTGVTNIATVNPSTGTGTFSNITPSTLSPNTQYTYKAYATNIVGTSYGTGFTFYTYANTPAAPVISNPTSTSLDLTIGSGDLNPAATQYAIQINGGSNYVQANGTATGAIVWLTALQWATTTLTGLASNTAYTFTVYARNVANIITASASATGTTAINTSPTLSAGILNIFGNAVCINTTSTANSFTLSGTNLMSAIAVGPLSGFSFNISETGIFENSLTLPPDTNGNISQVIYVKFTPTQVQTYSGTPIPISGGGAAAISVAVSGTGVNTPASVTTSGSSALTSTGATVAGSFTARCSVVISSGIEYSTNSNFTAATQIIGTFPISLINLSPNTQYYFRAFANDATGTVFGGAQNFTTLTIAVPTVLPATDVAITQFVAHWTAVNGATSYLLDVSINANFGTTINSSNLFISEYGEGSIGTKKYIEIFNGTGAAVNLTNYQIWGISNGGAWPESTLNFSANTTLANGQTYVIANNATDNPGANQYFNAAPILFTGNDAIGLAYNGGTGTTYTLLDAVGTAGADPIGWSVAGVSNATADHILIRKPTVLAPNLNWATSAGTTAENSEWTVSTLVYSTIGQNTNTGTHTINNNAPSYVSGYHDYIVAGTSQLVTGLEPHTTYFYRIRATSANSTSAYSSPAGSVTTAAEMPTFGGITQSTVIVCAGTNATFNLQGLIPASVSTISYTINGGATATVESVMADGLGNASIAIPLILSNNGQTLAITSIERTDFTAEILTINSGNTLVIGNVAALTTYYGDADGDGYGNVNVALSSCNGAPTYAGHLAVINNTDCNDQNLLVYRLGNFYTDSDNDGYFNGNNQSVEICYGATLPTGYTDSNAGSDCNDSNGEINSNHVEVLGNNLDDNCDGTIDEVAPTTSLIVSQCGITLENIANTLFANQVSGAQGYRFEVSHLGNVQTYDSQTNHFNLGQLPGIIIFGTTYSVRVAVKTSGFWRSYSSSCNVTTPQAPATTNVIDSQCGTTLSSMFNTIFANQVTAANQYRFEVTNGSEVRTYETSVNRFNFTNLLGGNLYGTTYSVRVALRFGQQWQEYGSTCSITTAATPGLTGVSYPQCGSTISNSWTTIFSNPVIDAEGYRFEVSWNNGISVRYYNSAVPRFNLRDLDNFTTAPDTAYTIRVAILFENVYQEFGAPCIINTAGAITRQSVAEIMDVKASPNPFTDTFRLSMKNTGEGTVKVMVYDMMGRQMDVQNMSISDAEAIELGSSYPSGVYSVVLIKDDSIETIRVIKR